MTFKTRAALGLLTLLLVSAPTSWAQMKVRVNWSATRRAKAAFGLLTRTVSLKERPGGRAASYSIQLEGDPDYASRRDRHLLSRPEEIPSKLTLGALR